VDQSKTFILRYRLPLVATSAITGIGDREINLAPIDPRQPESEVKKATSTKDIFCQPSGTRIRDLVIKGLAARLHCVYVETKLTQRLVDAAEPAKSGQIFIRDNELTGLALRITERGAKSLHLGRPHPRPSETNNHRRLSRGFGPVGP
jgi:hypothetical protein